jgi:hypothetical protein
MIREEHKYCVCTHMKWNHWIHNGQFYKCIQDACFCKGYKIDNLKYLEDLYERTSK